MSLFGNLGSTPKPPEPVATPPPPGVDNITSPVTQSPFTVPIMEGPPPVDVATVAPVEPVTPVIPDAQIPTPEQTTAVETPQADPLAQLNTTFGDSGSAPLQTVIIPGEPDVMTASPTALEGTLGDTQSGVAGDGELPEALGDHAVLGDQQPAIAEATSPGEQTIPEEGIIKPADLQTGEGVDRESVQEAIEVRDINQPVRKALETARDAIATALESIEKNPENKTGGE